MDEPVSIGEVVGTVNQARRARSVGARVPGARGCVGAGVALGWLLACSGCIIELGPGGTAGGTGGAGGTGNNPACLWP